MKTAKDQFAVQEDDNDEPEQVQKAEEVSTVTNEGLHQEVMNFSLH